MVLVVVVTAFLLGAAKAAEDVDVKVSGKHLSLVFHTK